ncbi:methane monooxygenase PmoA-like [Kribbella antiqua]|uniref:Methane monooxygenase PmoA-like n=1 Tax=Kribbella antiqua TaxID=2512217 RepID=A0A4R2ICM1_9ACTN|nr:PmoA family protein [Kribbella antiqua]TCO42304.1 methane monooxygenase PmoA-like [Kribbella antiqua]
MTSWQLASDGALLEGLARYVTTSSMPLVHSPRPYLHPLRSLAGHQLTEVNPDDHPHHYGLSLAVADVNGTSYWGGRTFVRDQGSIMLANHGRQVSTGLSADGPVLTDSVTWLDHHDRPQLFEQRSLTAAPLAEGWALSWRSELTSPYGVTIASPATNGRPGAGYGGIFWRHPPGEVLTPYGNTESAAHGSTSPWIALTTASTTVVLIQDDPLPWFVRRTGYTGAGPALAWDTPLKIAPGCPLTVSLRAVILDRRLTADEAADLAKVAR